jgi:pilus assembly protein Flp/PilA
MLASYVCIPPSVGAKRGSLVVAKVIKLLNKVRNDDDGVTMAEYAILIGLIAVVSITVIKTVGTDIEAVFTAVGTALGAILA